TAAHVVRNLPDRGEVALIRFPRKSASLQKQTIDMAMAEKLVIAEGNNGPMGPDLGFVRLPIVNVEYLQAPIVSSISAFVTASSRPRIKASPISMRWSASLPSGRRSLQPPSHRREL